MSEAGRTISDEVRLFDRALQWAMAKQGSAKQTAVEIIERLPNDSSSDEIREELIVNRMIEHGLGDVQAGRIITDEEMAKTIDSWRD
jgi:predicted transcriptional regulator